MKYHPKMTPVTDDITNTELAAKSLPKRRLLDEVHDQCRLRHYSRRTEHVYVGWIRRFILFQGRRHPTTMGGAEVEQFLTHLAVNGEVAAGTQNQALSALLFLYRHVLSIDLPWMENVVRAKRPQRVLVVVSASEVSRLLACLSDREFLTICSICRTQPLRPQHPLNQK